MGSAKKQSKTSKKIKQNIIYIYLYLYYSIVYVCE